MGSRTTLAPNPRGRRAERPPFVDALDAFAGRAAVVAADARLTYAELAERVRGRTEALGGGRRLVMICGGNDVDTLVTYLAALHGGHVAWLVPAGHAASLESAFDPDVVVSGAGMVIDERRAGSAHDLHPELALLLGTSGSTGAPRLVRLSHRSLQANAEAIAAYLGIGETERAATSLPVHYCYGLSVVNSHLLRGAGLVLTNRSVSDPGFWSLMREERATSFAGVPHTFDLLDRVGFEEMELPALRYVTQAGGRMAPARVRRYADLGARRGWRMVVMYGQTEATARIAYLPPDLAQAHPDAIGVPIPGGSLEIRDVPEAVDPGVGELVYRGPNVMLGYAEHPGDLTLGRVVHELRTGDLGRRDASGLFRVVGRRSRFLKLFGLRVDLDEAERMLDRGGVEAVCGGTDERLVVVATGDEPPARIARMLGVLIGVPAAAIQVHVVDEIPLLPNGKTDYAAVSALPATTTPGRPRDSGTSPAGDPRDRRSRTVAAVFCEAFDRDEVGDDDTFAGLGGDSLSYVEVSLALEDVLGHLPAEWPEMSVRDLSLLARRRRRGARVETNVVLRAAAIVLVVASHMTAFWPAGGAHLLLALAGHSFARFRLPATDSPRRLAQSATTIARIAVPTSVWIGLQVLLAGGYSVGAMLLVNNYVGAQTLSDGRWHYWFLEALVQILIVLTALFCIPSVRRLERHRPLAFVLGLLLAALVFRFDLLSFGADDNRIFRPHTVVWVFLLGWAVHRARTPAARGLVSIVVLLAVPGFFGETARETIVVAGLLLLIWVPVIVIPRPLSRAIGIVAAASLAIYLTHWQVFPPLAGALPLEVALPATLAVGIGAWWLLERLAARATRTKSSLAAGLRRPPPTRPPAPDGRPRRDAGHRWGTHPPPTLDESPTPAT